MNVLKGAVAASIAVFAWGFVFWWSQLPYRTLNQVDNANEAEVSSYLQAQFLHSGVHMFPKPGDDPRNLEDFRKKAGSAITVYRLADEDMLPLWGTLLAGFLRIFVATLLIGWALKLALPGLRDRYSAKVGFIVLIAIGMAIYRNLGDSIWWYYPWSWSLVKALHDVVAWIIAGLVLSCFIRMHNYRV